MSKEIAAIDEKRALAVSKRPDYLPALTEDSYINQVNQRANALPILSTNNDEWTLLEGTNVIHKFKNDELRVFFLFVYFDTQRRAFEDEWDEENPQDPICQSNNNIEPLSNSPDPQSETCAECWRSQEETKRRDKCSYLRNAIVLIEYESGGQTVEVLARLRLNGGTLYGEENRSAGELNGESYIRELKRMEAEFWYHPVLMWFDTDSANARNKVMFEILYDEFPTEEQAQHILGLQKEYNWQELTMLRFVSKDDGDESGTETESKAPRQRKTAQAASESGETKTSRSRRSAAKDTAGDDGKGSDTPTRSRRSRKKEADESGDTGAESKDAGEAADTGSGEGSGVESDNGDADPVNDPEVANLIGNVELP